MMGWDFLAVFYFLNLTLLFLAAVAGLIVSLTYWHRRGSPRIAAAAFGLAVLGQVTQAAYFLASMFSPTWATENHEAATLAFISAQGLLVVGAALTVFAFWRSWRETAAAKDAALPGEAGGTAP